MAKRRKFSAEFKRGAVEQASQPGVSCAQVARELGIRDNLLTRWKREAQSQGKVAFGGTGTPRDEELAGLAVNVGNKLGTQRFWETEPCAGPDADHAQPLASTPVADGLAAASSGAPAAASTDQR